MVVYPRESRRRPILILVIVTSLALITLDARGNGVIGSIRSAARDIVAPAQDVVHGAFDPVRDFFDGVTSYSSLREENARLKAKISQLEGAVSKERAVGKEFEELKALLDLQDSEDAAGVVARVVNGAPGAFERTVIINKGTSKGVDVGMPVVAGNGLVGQITEASSSRATVTLIDSPGNGVGVRTERKRALGIAVGRSAQDTLRLNLENPRADISEGELVFTSGVIGSAYPPDITVGTIVKIDRSRGDLDPDIFVKPTADLDTLVFVKVLRPNPAASISGSGGG